MQRQWQSNIMSHFLVFINSLPTVNKWIPLQPLNDISMVLPHPPPRTTTTLHNKTDRCPTSCHTATTSNIASEVQSLDTLDHTIGTPTKINTLIKNTIKNKESLPNDIPVKNAIGKFCLMYPTGYALNHENARLLLGYAEHGCPVDCGAN